ncbi:MAG TPA: helix-turn-helix domain-containing protein [Candidatus Luteimonas excrementigallinarum]|nr:helix-turn-helix domain-containing protein [Candidatus Luteimonas excrementigallinarum]
MMNAKKNALAGGTAQGADNAGFGGLQSDSITARKARPTPGTARAAVLDALLQGERLTSRIAWDRFGTSRLAADIYALRRMGWSITATAITVQCRFGRSSVVTAYSLDTHAQGPRHER